MQKNRGGRPPKRVHGLTGLQSNNAGQSSTTKKPKADVTPLHPPETPTTTSKKRTLNLKGKQIIKIKERMKSLINDFNKRPWLEINETPRNKGICVM